MDIKLIDITDIQSFPALRDLNPEEEAAIIARYKASLDPAALEAECRELLELHQRGKLLEATDVFPEPGSEGGKGKAP